MRMGVCVLHASGDVVSIVCSLSFFKVCIYLLVYFGCDAANLLKLQGAGAALELCAQASSVVASRCRARSLESVGFRAVARWL